MEEITKEWTFKPVDAYGSHISGVNEIGRVENAPSTPKMKIACLYHADSDGFASAYSAWYALNDRVEFLFIEVQYGEEFPAAQLEAFAPDQVYILDFSYPSDTIRACMVTYPTVVIDHHKTAAENLREWNPQDSGPECPCGHEKFSPEADDMGSCIGECPGFINAVEKVGDHTSGLPLLNGVRVNTEFAGCILSWLHFNPEEEPPPLLFYVQDRDLWKWQLENSKEINAYIATMPNDFEEWEDFYLPGAYESGKALMAQQAKQVAARCAAAEMVEVAATPREVERAWETMIYTVPCVNATENVSEVGDVLCLANPEAPFSMTYADRPGGLRSYSLRSRNGFDVSEVAKAWGGGGHPGAAGFTLPSPKVI